MTPKRGGNAPAGEGWTAPRHRACAYVTTTEAGVAAEARGLFAYYPDARRVESLRFY